MGNNQSCCWSKNKGRPSEHQRRKYAEERHLQVPDEEPVIQPPRGKSNSNNLQHISEREPDDMEEHPSDHPKANTIFLTRSKSEIQHGKNDKHDKHKRNNYDSHHKHFTGLDGKIHKKYSSCSTIFIDDSTVSKPDLKNTIKAVALAIYFHIKNRENREDHELEEKLLDIFDERLHPLTKEALPDDYDIRDPEHKTIYRFIRTIFNAAQLTAECAIVTLVYLERLLTYADIEIVPGNWRRIVLGAILLASKVWDDQAVWNVDYCQILKDITVEDMNELERQFLEMLQFNINVPSSVYAKYYFDLRALVDAHDLTLPMEPLTKERALKLEAMSSVCDDRIKRIIQSSKLKRSQSLDGFPLPYGSNRAILS